MAVRTLAVRVPSVVADVTVSVVLPEILPEVALMSVEPIPVLTARPPAETEATEVVPEDQATEDVISHDVPSEYVPAAMN